MTPPRFIFAAACVILAIVLGQVSRIGVANSLDEATAAAQWPRNGFAMAAVVLEASQLRSTSQDAANPDLAALKPTDAELPLARAALAREPLASDALLLLALDAGAKGDDARLSTLLQNAQNLTRRNSLVSLIQLNRTIGQGQVSDALSSLDRIVGVHPELMEGLLPVLVGQVANEDARPDLVQMLDRKPFWEERFWRGVMPRRELFGPASQIRLALSGTHDGVAAFDRTYLRYLARRQEYDTAFSYYRAIGGQGGGVGDNLIQGRPVAAGGRIAPIDWAVSSDNGVQAVFAESPISLSIQSLAASGGKVASRLVSIPASGNYQLIVSAEDEPQIPAEVTLRCATSGGAQLRLALDANAREFAIPFSVARDGCSVYTLQIDVTDSDRSVRDMLVLKRIAIEPAS